MTISVLIIKLFKLTLYSDYGGTGSEKSIVPVSFLKIKTKSSSFITIMYTLAVLHAIECLL